MWHVETDYFALAVFLIMLIKKRRIKKGITFQDNVFSMVLLLSLISVIVDIISSTVMNDITNWWVYQCTMTIYVITMPMLAAVWVCYTVVIIFHDDTKKVRPIMLVVLLPFSLYMILALSNPFTSLFFHLTADIEYSRGPLFMPIGVGLIMLYSVIGVIIVLGNRRRIEPKSNVLLLVSFFAASAISIWVQLANPGWLVINAAYAVVYVFCDMTIEEQQRNLLYEQISRQNQSMEEAVKKAEIANRAKTDFLARMSHDMRTPMNAIIGLSNLAADTENLSELHDYMNKINTSGKQLLSLINDVLDVSRIENGKLEMKREYIMLSDLLKRGVVSSQAVAEEKGVAFRMESKDLEDFLVYVDSLKIMKILTNLLTNAVKFTPQGGTVTVAVENVGKTAEEAEYKITFSDTGIGISQEFLEHIFEPFTQEKREYMTNYTGTGLGMTIVKELVDFLGGSLEIHSELGKGTDISLQLSLQLAQEQPATKDVTDETDEKPGGRILVAEDHPLNREIIVKLLQKEGYEVELAQNGKVCVDLFRSHEKGYYDLILMDIRMPEMDGLTAAKSIRKLESGEANSIPIVAMTANAFEQDIDNSIQAGMNDHLSKPVEPQLLRAVLQKEMHYRDERQK